MEATAKPQSLFGRHRLVHDLRSSTTTYVKCEPISLDLVGICCPFHSSVLTLGFETSEARMASGTQRGRQRRGEGTSTRISSRRLTEFLRLAVRNRTGREEIFAVRHLCLPHMVLTIFYSDINLVRRKSIFQTG